MGEPIWPTGTPLEVVLEWQAEHYCVECYFDCCEYCDGQRGDGARCECTHALLRAREEQDAPL